MTSLTYRIAYAAFAGSLLLAACVAPAKQAPTAIDPGQYVSEADHSSLVFQVKHFGLSWYTMRFNQLDVSLDFDPTNPSASAVKAVIDPRSIDVWHSEKPADWNTELATDPRFLEADAYPQITFTSTRIDVTGDNTGVMTGNLSLKGVTKPITMDVTYNGSNAMPWAPNRKLVGFSASGAFNRSDFGMTAMLPNIVSDEVRFRIEIELQPAD